MLVLTRKLRETIVIDTEQGPIVIEIIKLNSNRVRVGIDAPKNFPISRSELLTNGNESAINEGRGAVGFAS